MNSVQIENTIQNIAEITQSFRGVYSSDTLPFHNQLNGVYICNTDPSNKPGTHWVALFLNGNQSNEYFSSLKQEPLPIFHSFLNHRFKSCQKQLQNSFSASCGVWVIFYVILKCCFISLEQIENLFGTDSFFNEILLKFYLDLVVGDI